MKRPKLKKASKRMSCHKRFKIQKKVREHNRKVRKQAKKAKKEGHFRKPKKDLSIPNAAPFKEDILREAELRKQAREELKKARKLERQKEQEKKRKQKEQKTEKKEKKVINKAPKSPLHAVCIQVNKAIETSDVVLEVLDARDPLGSRCLQAEQAVLQSPDKKLLLVLNKTDLVPKDNLEKWLHILNKELPTIAFKCSTEVREKNLPSTGRKAKSCSVDVSKGTVCRGRDTLLRVLRELCPSPDKMLKVGLIGFSNVGKSSLINSLKQSKVCNVGSLKGTTRFMQEINTDQGIRLIDSPSLVVSPDNPPVTLAMRSVFQKGGDDFLNAVPVILEHCDKQQTMLHYNIADFRNSEAFLDLLARRRGMLKKGAVPDVNGAAKLFLNEWMGARLSYHTVPTASSSFHITSEQQTAMLKVINMNKLEKDNKNLIKDVHSPSPASSILFHFSHMTNGILDEAEIEWVNPEPEDQEVDEEEQADDDGVDEEEQADDDDVEVVEEEDDNKEKKSKKTILKPAAKQTDLAKETTSRSEPDLTEETASKSVRFDETEQDANDTYDFNTDFY